MFSGKQVRGKAFEGDFKAASLGTGNKEVAHGLGPARMSRGLGKEGKAGAAGKEPG